MWTLAVFVWFAGAALTAMNVLQNRVFRDGGLVNAAAIALWPAYWGYFLVSMLFNRTPRGPRP